ncbi:family 43 glycosylhydrolase [Haloferula sp. BvORR071]|uniref:family 43 glycosylhydrolase n=1 Tax=Haloferula sp. BvORR071 TaxID=1396141 RepID=UPI00069846D2|nr:family 43 glycosylhydrolase [Haloferula sp. BvORR071]
MLLRVATLLLSATAGVLAAAPALPFKEDFTAFPSSTWKIHGGEWSAKGGELHVSGGMGPKAEIAELQAGDFQLDVELQAESEGAQAGVIFRGDEVAEGVDAFRGYYVGLKAGGNIAAWGATDPKWRGIAVRPFEVKPKQWYHLQVQAAGNNVKVFLDDEAITESTWPVFDGIDAAFAKGGFALRALDGAASFRNLQITAYRAATLSRSYTNPVQGGCADPVVFHKGGKYYAYTTYSPDFPRMTRGIRLYTSDNLVNWTDEGFVLKNEDSWGNWGFWAPDIVEKDGIFYLYYAADERMCVATAISPMGPFKQEKEAPITPESIRIDGHVFTDEDGQRYFYYVTFGDGNEIWGGKLNADMVSVDQSSLKQMVKPDQAWERHQAKVTEGPAMLKHKGIYYLTYSGSHFESPEDAMGYATSDSPLGPWKKYEFNPVMKSTEYAHGTAHHCFTESPDGKEIFIVYHRHHTLKETEPRALSIDRVRFVPDPKGGPDILEIHGPTSSPQALPSGAR